MPKIKMSSDGTVEGTKLILDGADLTDEDNIVSVQLYASVQYGKYVNFSYTSKETNEDGSTELTEYRYHMDEEDEEPTMRKVVRPAGIGKPTEDEAALLNATATVGGFFNKPMVIDRRHVSRRHAAFVQELMKGRKYDVVEEG